MWLNDKWQFEDIWCGHARKSAAGWLGRHFGLHCYSFLSHLTAACDAGAPTVCVSHLTLRRWTHSGTLQKWRHQVVSLQILVAWVMILNWMFYLKSGVYFQSSSWTSNLCFFCIWTELTWKKRTTFTVGRMSNRNVVRDRKLVLSAGVSCRVVIIWVTD